MINKGSFRLSIPLCCVPHTQVKDPEKAHQVYNWMRIACYQYSVLNVLLSVIMFVVIFIPHNDNVNVSFEHSRLIQSSPTRFCG